MRVSLVPRLSYFLVSKTEDILNRTLKDKRLHKKGKIHTFWVLQAQEPLEDQTSTPCNWLLSSQLEKGEFLILHTA